MKKTVLLLFAILSACFIFISCRSGVLPSSPDALPGNSKNSLKNIKIFTVIVRTDSGQNLNQIINERIQKKERQIVPVSVYTVSQFPKNRKIEDPVDFEEIWGKSLEETFRKKGIEAKFISLSKAGVTPFDNEINGSSMNWLSEVGVDTVIVIRQNQLQIDHTTRLKPGAMLQTVYTLFLWADVWWIDTLGNFFVVTSADIVFYNMSSAQKTLSISGLSSVHKSGKHLYGSLVRNLDSVLEGSVAGMMQQLENVL